MFHQNRSLRMRHLTRKQENSQAKYAWSCMIIRVIYSRAVVELIEGYRRLNDTNNWLEGSNQLI